ncbi:MAG: TauD/TfdA family dioxygenase [Asticcacaulis sp.]
MGIATRIATEYAPLLTRPFEPKGFEVHHLSPFIGTKVTGLDLRQELPEETKASLRDLLRERAVIYFRDQHLSAEEQLKVTAIFGTPQVSDIYREGSPLPGVGVIDSVNEIAGRVSRWHADMTSQATPSTIRFLNAVELPPHGGDTHFASTEAAYARLSEPLKELADSLTAIHNVTPVTLDGFYKPRSGFHWNEHPVVRVHPETGRRSLYVNPRFTQEIVGLQPHESAAVLKLFYDHIVQPEHLTRVQWKLGTLVVWDNRTSLHYAADDYGAARRRLYSTSVVSTERPLGVND